MQPNYDPRVGRYSKPSKELLIDYINFINNRKLLPTQLNFQTPVELDDTGLVSSDVSFSSDDGWSDEVEPLIYRRVDLNDLLNGAPLTIHTLTLDTPALLAAIFQQYGLLLEPALLSVVEQISVSDAPAVDPLPYLQNSTFVITFTADHLIFYGSVTVITRASLTLLGGTIDSLMDLRQFYNDSNDNLPPVELIIKDGELEITDVTLPMERGQCESALYVIPIGTVLNALSELPTWLRKLTGDEWVCIPDQSLPFNLFAAEVIYNGFVTVAQTVKDPAFNYIFCLDLSQWCNNITGILKIAYRYSDSKIPGNLLYNHASTPQLFYR